MSMHATGIVRSTDDLGRIVIPKPIRQQFGIEEGSRFEYLTTKDGDIVLRRYLPEVPVVREPVKYRVVYYTMQGCRSRDYPAEQKDAAVAFYDRHVRNHPDYQNRSWSKTELIPIYESGDWS